MKPIKYADGGPFTKDNSPYGQHPFGNYNPENGNFFYRNHIPYDVAGERESLPDGSSTPGAEYFNSVFDYDAMGNLVKEPITRLSAIKTIENAVGGAQAAKDYSIHFSQISIVLVWTFIFILTSYYILKKRDL